MIVHIHTLIQYALAIAVFPVTFLCWLLVRKIGYLEVGLLFQGLDLAHSDEQLFLHHYLMDQLSEVNYSCLAL